MRERQAFKKQAHQLLVRHIAAQRSEAAKKSIMNNRAFSKAKKLHTLQSLLLPAPGGSLRRCVDQAAWDPLIAEHFGGKWKTADLQQRLNVLDFELRSESHEPQFSCGQVGNAIARLRNPNKIDAHGLCPRVLHVMFSCQPHIVADYINMAAASTPTMSSMCIDGRVYGKSSPHSLVKDLRAIMPLPACLQILDVLFADYLHDWINRVLPLPRGTIAAARKGFSGFGYIPCFAVCD